MSRHFLLAALFLLLALRQPDEFAEFQTTELVYHDDVGDYSTNKPTMDGAADAILMIALWNR